MGAGEQKARAVESSREKKTVGKGERRRFVRTGLSVERPKQEGWEKSIQSFQKGRQIGAGTELPGFLLVGIGIGFLTGRLVYIKDTENVLNVIFGFGGLGGRRLGLRRL